MKYYILSILLIASVSLIISAPDSFAQVEKGINYDKEILSTNPDGSKNVKWTSTNPRILDNGIYKDYIFTETANALKITTSNGFVSLDKNSCGFNFDNKFTDSIVAYNTIVDLYSWNALNSINSATCEAYYDQGNDSLVAKRYASGVGFMEYKYIFNNGSWKTQLEATNLTSLTDRVFGFDQTIDLNRDIINYGGQKRNLDNFSGQTFDRTWLENNEGNFLDFMNTVYFDLDIGFEYLDSISITDTGANKSKLTFHYMRNNALLLPDETLIIDPTFGYTSGTWKRYYSDVLVGGETNCRNDVAVGGSDTNSQGILRSSDGVSQRCQLYTVINDLSSVPTGIYVSSANVRHDVAGISSPNGCDIFAVTYDPDVDSDATIYADSYDGNEYASNDTTCDSTGNNKIIALNSLALTDIETLAGGDFTFSMVQGNWDSISGTSETTLDLTGGSIDLEFTYTTSPPIPIPDSIVDLTLDSVTQTTATVSFSTPNYNGGNLTTNTFNLDTPQNNNVLTFFANSTDNPFLITGLTLGTSYSANATVITEGGANYTLANILNFTTSTWNPPGSPTLSAIALSDTAIRYTSVPGTAGDNSTAWFSLQCELNGAGGWLNSVNNNTYVSFYEYTGLTLGDSLICQWRDGSADGWSSWSNNATDTLTLAILSGQRTIADTDDKLMQFINMVSGMGGVYFGLGVLPFGIMLIGFMAGKKTVRIFTLATLMLMGIVHASGYYVYPNWYWTLCLLFGLVLIMGRMKSD